MASGINVIFRITDLASSTLANVRSEMSRVASGITQASTALFFWSEAFNQIKAASSQFYGLFIGQNEKMRQQILATQSSLAAVQDVYINGVKSIDPTETIQAFEAPIRKSLNQIAVESLDLVGVTSGQLTDLLQIALTNATKITNQSKDFADPIKAAERLTLSFAGAFGAMQIPLFQARQEINSILSGTIDMNSRLAKGLSITNEQVRAWGAQGVLVDKLVNKLQPFVAGNALAARSVSGITSNIQEILEITTRLAGENLTVLFVDGLDVIYQYMKAIQPQIQATLNGVTGFISDSVKQIIEILNPFLPTFAVLRDAVLSIGGSIGEIIGGSVQTLLSVLATVSPIIAPIFELLVSIVKIVADLLSDPVIQQMVQMALIITTVIGPLTTIATLVATISGFFASGGGLVGFFTLLSTVAPGLVASLGALGSALASIAGFGGTAGAIAASGSSLAVLSGAIVTVTAALAPLALAIAAVASAAMLWQSLKVGDAREALEAVGARSDVTASGANNTTLKLRQLRDTEIIQGDLTDKQKADKEALTSQARNYATQLEAEIAAAKEINTAGDESLENAKAALIASNEQALKGLGKFTSGLTTSAKPLTELGGIITQLEKKVAAFEAQIKAANSDPEFQTANKGIIELITKQAQLGQLSAEEGKKRLNGILGDSRVEIAGKEAAQKAIAQLQEISTKKQLDQSQAAQSEIEKMQNEGRIGEVKAEQMVTDQKLKEIKIRSDSQKTAHAEKMRQIQAEMNADLGVIDKEIANKQSALDKLKAGKAPEVQIVQAQRDLDSSKSRRADKQSEFVAVQIEENRKNAIESAKLDAEQSKLEKQQRDIRKREALKDFDERQKINDSAREQGLKDNQQAAIESIAIAEERAKTELSQIKERTAKLETEAKKQGKTVKEYDKEAWEALQVQQAEALQKLASARKDGFEKRLSDIKQDAQEATAIVEAAQAKNDIDNQKAATRTTEIAKESINTQIALLDREIAANQGNKERLEELNAKRAVLEKDLTEVHKKQLQQRLSDLQQDADERVSVIKAANATGVIENQEAAKRTAAIESASSKTQLQVIQARIAEVIAADKKRGKVSTELLEDLRKQEADTQVKITEITKKEMETRLADLKEDVAERTAVIKASQATGAIDNQTAVTQTAIIERTGAAQRLEIVRQRIQQIAAEGKKSGKVNVELMEALRKQEAEIQVELTDIDKKAMDARLSDLQQDAEERVSVVQSANALGTKDNQQAAIATSQIQQKSANDQLKIVRERIATVIEEGKKSGKINTELLEELRKREADIQVKITEIQKQELQKRLSDLQQDAEERTAVITAENATGILDNQEAATKTEKIQQDSLESQLKLIQQRIKTTNPANKELLEELRKQEADTQVKITEIQKQALQKRLADLREDAEERTALIAAANATGIIDNQQAATQTAKVQQDGLNAEIELVRKRISTVSPKNKELLEELRKQEADIQVKITEVQKQETQKRLSDLEQDATERITITEAANAQGLLDNQQAAAATTKIQEESASKQIEIIRKRIEQVRAEGQKVGKVNVELLEELQAQEANAQKKLAEIRKQFLQKQLSDLQQDADERLSIVAAQNAKGDIDNQVAATQSSAIQKQNLDSQLVLIKNQLKTVGATNKELREELLKQEADIQVKITENQKQELQKRLADLREDADERTTLITSANARGIIDNQQAATQTAKIQQDGLKAQLQVIQSRMAGAGSNKELLEELQKQEAEVQIKITETQKQEMDKRISDLERDAAERVSIAEAAHTEGLLDNQQAAAATAKIQETSASKQIEIIRARIEQVIAEGKRLGTVNIELLEELQAQEADAQKKLVEIRKQAFQKQLSDLQQDSQELVVVAEATAAMGLKDTQESAIEIQGIQEQGIQNQLKLVRSRIAEVGPLNKESNEELKAQEAKLQKELTDIQEQGFQKRLSDLQQDGEERLAIVTSNDARGLADNQETALKSAAIQEESAQKQLTLIQERLIQTSETSIELREKLLKQEADTQAKISEIRKQAFDKRLADVEQDGQEQQTILEGQLAQGLTTESEYAEILYNLSLQSLDAQFVLIRERRSKISATDIEGQEALAAQEASLQKRRQDALSQFLEAQLSLLDRENKKATDLLEQSELDRKLITKQAALSGSADKDAAATAEIQATQRRIQQEIALEEQKNATLQSLPAFSDPAKEAERQSRIRASVKKTTELRLQLLDEEKKAFDLLIDRQIRKIQNQSRAQELASDVQMRAIEQQGKQYDLLSRSLENQNKLLQSRATLAGALNNYIQGEYKILQDSAGSEGERKRLIKEAADAQLIAIQQQQVVAQKNLDIEIKQAEIAQKRAEFEAEIAEIRARSGLAKADAEVLKAEATLQKVQRDPNASNADVEAAKLDVTAARAAAEAAAAEIAAAIANKEMVGQNGEVLKVQNDLKRETQSIEQVTQGRAAQAQAIEAIVDENEKKLRQRQLAGRLTPEESERLARIQRENQQREATRRQNEIERDALRGVVTPNGVRRGIQAAGARSASLLGEIEQTAATAPKVPELKNLVTQMNVQRQQISAIKPDVNPLIRLQEESTGYQKEILGVLKQLNGKPTPVPTTPVTNNFNTNAQVGVSEAQVLGIFGQVAQNVSRSIGR